MAQNEFTIRIRAITDDFKRAMSQAADAARKVAEQTTTATKTAMAKTKSAVGMISAPFKKVGDAVKGAIGFMNQYKIAIGTVTVAIGATVKAYADWEKGLKEINTLTGMSADQLRKFSDEALKVMSQYGMSAKETTKALYQAISAGVDASEATKFLGVAAKMAIGGLTSLDTAVDGLTSLLNAYGLSVEDASKISDQFFIAMKAGKTTIDELSKSMGLISSIAAQAGVGTDELLASISALTKGGMRTSDAVVYLRQVLAAVIKPTAEAQKIAKQLGLEFNATALRSKGLAGFLADVKEKTGGNIKVMAKLFGSVQALQAALALTGEQGKDFQAILAEMQNSAGATEKAYAEMSNTIAFKFRLLRSKVSEVLIRIGSLLEGPVKVALDLLIKGFDTLLKIFKKLHAINPFAFLSKSKKTTGILAGYKTAFEGLKEASRSVGKIFVALFKIIGSVVRAFKPLLTLIGKLIGYLTGTSLKLIGKALGFIFSLLGKLLTKLADVLMAVAKLTQKIANKIADFIVRVIATINRLIDGTILRVRWLARYVATLGKAGKFEDYVKKLAEAGDVRAKRFLGLTERKAEVKVTVKTEGMREASKQVLALDDQIKGLTSDFGDFSGAIEEAGAQAQDAFSILTDVFGQIENEAYASLQAVLDALENGTLAVEDFYSYWEQRAQAANENLSGILYSFREQLYSAAKQGKVSWAAYYEFIQQYGEQTFGEFSGMLQSVADFGNSLVDGLGNSFKKLYKDMIDPAVKAEDAWKNFSENMTNVWREAIAEMLASLTKLLIMLAAVYVISAMTGIPLGTALRLAGLAGGQGFAGGGVGGVLAGLMAGGVPGLAEGGIVQKPITALVGEAGPEAVIPLEKLGKLNFGGQNNYTVNITVEGAMDEFTADRIVREHILPAIKRWEEVGGE